MLMGFLFSFKVNPGKPKHRTFGIAAASFYGLDTLPATQSTASKH